MPISWKKIEENAVEFSKSWEGASYEKGESQTFYNELFGVFGIKRRNVARFEEHVRKLNNKSGFIDLFWPKVLIVEHKSLGANLDDAADQAGDYFDSLDDDLKPRHQLVCDFQRFSLLDRDSGEHTEFNLPNLYKNVRSFSFMLGLQSPKHRVSKHLNVKAAQYIEKIHIALKKTGYPRKDQEIFLTQLVFCLFADHTGIFQPRGIFIDLIECKSRVDGSDLGQLLAYLFQILDTPYINRQTNLDPELAEFPHVNGGLFSEHISIPGLSREVRDSLLLACEFDWSEVSPAIFGSLYQAVLSDEECRDLAAFATSEQNILKVLNELFIDELQKKLDTLSQPGVRRVESLYAFLDKLSHMTFFDPACGCGNFLAVAYRELRKFELAAIRELCRLGELKEEAKCSSVDVDQFYGIELHSYSARIAMTAMWMTDHIANNELSQTLGVDFHRIPLKRKPTIIVDDALDLDWESVLSIGDCSILVSNPPYKGNKKQTEEEREKVRKITEFSSSKGTLDYACGWIIKAANYAAGGVRVGLVTTNSVVQGEQIGQLWPMLFDNYLLKIDFAHQTFQWNTDSRGKKAQVQVVILGLTHNSMKQRPNNLYLYKTAGSSPKLLKCEHISPYLIAGDNLSHPNLVVKSTSNPRNGFPKLKTGTKPIDGGYYILSAEEKASLILQEPRAEKFIRPFIGTTEFLENKERFILVLSEASAIDLKAMPIVRSLIDKVTQYRRGEIGNKSRGKKLKSANELYKRPTSFHITTLPTSPFLVLPEVTSENRQYLPIGWLEPPVVPSNLVKIGIDATLEQFALLTSAMHMAWLKGIGGHLEGRNRYSIGIVYNNFPPPREIKPIRLKKLAKAVLKARDKEVRAGSSLQMMYDAYAMPANLKAAHLALDDEVDRQYLGKVAKNNQERIIALLNQYGQMIQI